MLSGDWAENMDHEIERYPGELRHLRRALDREDTDQPVLKANKPDQNTKKCLA